MGYTNSLQGEIKVQPPLVRAEAEDPLWESLWGLKLRTAETSTITYTERVTRLVGDAIVPAGRDGGGTDIQQELQLIADLLGPDRVYTGWLHVTFEAGLCGPDEAPCERYYIDNETGRAFAVSPELIWPEEVR